MKKFQLKRSLGIKPLLALGVLASRWGWLPANVSPLGSFGFFGGSIGWYLASIIAFDWLKGGFYQGFLFTYLGFLMYPLLGRLGQGRNRAQLLLLPLASLAFFLLSNLGVWLYWYPRTLTGLMACYLAAVPFYSRTLIGDGLFGYGYWFYRLYRRTNLSAAAQNQTERVTIATL